MIDDATFRIVQNHIDQAKWYLDQMQQADGPKTIAYINVAAGRLSQARRLLTGQRTILLQEQELVPARRSFP